MTKLRKIFTVSVMVMTVIVMSGLVAPKANAAAQAGDLIKKAGLSAVYYLGSDGKRYVFPNTDTYMSWYNDFSGVITVDANELSSYPLGGNVVQRAGTKLVKITTDPTVYAVEPNGMLRSIVSEANATALWGSNWAQRVIDVSDSFFTNYTIGTPLTAGVYPVGSLVKNASSSTLYYWDGSAYRQFASESAFTANRFKMTDVVTISSPITAGGTQIMGAESALIKTSQGGSVPGYQAGQGTGLTISLASDTPAGTTYIRDTGAVVAQSVAAFTKLNFTASNDGDVTVKTVKLTRSGISSDSDLGTVYLYDGMTQIAENTSISNKVITFTNNSGLFTVTSGTTKTILVKADISAANASVSGIVLGVNAATDITTGGAAVTGSFPVNGNQMAVGTVADLGYANITAVTTYPASIDPGKTNEELWRFTTTANDQDMLIKYIKMTVVGTVSTADLANLKLEVAGTQVGGTVTAVPTSKEIIFDLSSNPFKITSGQSKVFVVKGDVVSGSSRAFKFTIRKVSDFIVTDNNYGVQVAPLFNGAAFSLIEPTTGSGTAINAGNLTVAVASDSPTGNITTGATGVSLAKFTYKATGEDIKITNIRVSVNEEGDDADIKNGKLYFNGTQVGSTDTSVTDEANVDFAMSQIIPAGSTATIEYKADTISDETTGGQTAGSALTAGQTLVVTLAAGTTWATGQASLSSVANATATGKTVTAAAGTLLVAKNIALADYTTTNPTGVVGANGVKVASLSINAPSGEGVTITQLVIGDDGDDATEDFGDNFQNLTLKHGTTQLATTQGTLSGTAGADFTFTLSPSISIAAGQQYVVDVYADILTGAAGYAAARTGLEFVNLTATGNTTNGDAYPTATVTDLQNLVVATTGTLVVTADPATPAAAQLVMGTSDNEVAKLKLTAGNSENINVTRIKLTDTSTAANSLSNVRLYDGSTLVGSAVASFDAATNGVAEFNLATPLVITKGTAKTLTVKADVNGYPNATSASTHVVNLASNANIDSLGASSGTGITETVTSATGLTMTVVRTKLSMTKDATSPSGASSPMAGQTVLVLNLTNTSNVDNQDAKLTDLALTIGTSGTWGTVGTRSVKVYRDSISTGNLMGQKDFAATAALASIAYGGWATTNDANPTAASLKDVTVAAGASLKLIVTIDTNEATNPGSLTVSVPSSSGVKWEDGVSTAGSAITSIDSLPVTGGTLTY